MDIRARRFLGVINNPQTSDKDNPRPMFRATYHCDCKCTVAQPNESEREGSDSEDVTSGISMSDFERDSEVGDNLGAGFEVKRRPAPLIRQETGHQPPKLDSGDDEYAEWYGPTEQDPDSRKGKARVRHTLLNSLCRVVLQVSPMLHIP